MKKMIWFSVFVMVGMIAFAQEIPTPEEAGVVPVTGDFVPWRAYGVDAINFDTVWILALNNGRVVVFKRGNDFEAPGVISGSEFLMFEADGSLVTPFPVHGSFESNGEPTPNVDFASTGLGWGAFTLGAHADRANATGFVVHNLGENFANFDLDHGDVVGDEAFSLVQLFDNDGNPIGSGINAFGDLTAVEGDYRDIGAVILSNGNIVVLGENRQFSDPLLDEAGASVSEAVIAVILAPDGSTKVDPFVVHTDEDGLYIGTGGTSAVFQNMTVFEGGFVIDYGQGIRWYNNDGTPITPVQADHAELADEDAADFGLFIGENSGGRGDSMAWASNGIDKLAKSIKVESGGDSVGVLIYYNIDGTVKNWVRFDDVDILAEAPMVDRTFCDMDEDGNVFVVWQDLRFAGDGDGGHAQVFGRFFDSEGEPYGPSFPVFENWKNDPETVDFGGSIGQVPLGDLQQPRCAMNGQVAAVVSASTIYPDIPELFKQLSNAFDLVITDVVVRIFENPFAEDVAISEWALY